MAEGKLTVSEDALVAHLDGEAVLLHAGSKDYYRLNETGQVIWRVLEQGGDEDAVVAALTAAFEVDADEARRESNRIIAELLAAGLLSTGP